MLTILITGGLGFLGSHTCVSLIERGYKIIILDSLVNSSKLNFGKIEQISSNFKFFNKEILSIKYGDVRNIDFLREIFKK